jgi:hypothetical protein
VNSSLRHGFSAVLARLNLRTDESGAPRRRLYNDLDAIWEHPVTGARVYVGNLTAASTRSILDAHHIRHVVNCQEAGSKNFFEERPAEDAAPRSGRISYLRFPISQWWRSPMSTEEEVIAFFNRPFEWIHEAASKGSSVLIHCLAGAHRAGTTGVAFIMYSASLNMHTALPLARRIRSIIDPIGILGELLQKYDAALKKHPHRALGKILAPPQSVDPGSAGALASAAGSLK